MATIALFWIVLSIIGTWLIIIFSDNWNQQVELTPDQIEQLQDLIKSQSGTTSTWEIDTIENTIEIK